MKSWQIIILAGLSLLAIGPLAIVGWRLRAYDAAWVKWDSTVESVTVGAVGKFNSKELDALFTGYETVPCKMNENPGRRSIVSRSPEGKIDADRCTTYTIWGETFASFGRWHAGVDLYFDKKQVLVGYVHFIE